MPREDQVDPDRRAGFCDFVVADGPRLLKVAFLLTGERSAAEDLRQDVLERLYVAWPRVEEPFAYARVAMARRAVNRWRLRSRRPEIPLVGETTTAVADHADRVSERATVVAALARLGPRQRAAIVLRYFEDLSEADTALALGCSVGNVKSQTARGLANLRALLADDAAELTTRRH